MREKMYSSNYIHIHTPLCRISNPTQYSFGISNPNMPLLRIANPQQLKWQKCKLKN